MAPPLLAQLSEVSVPSHPTWEDASHASKEAVNRLRASVVNAQVEDPDGSLRRIRSDEVAEPFLALSRISGAVEQALNEQVLQPVWAQSVERKVDLLTKSLDLLTKSLDRTMDMMLSKWDNAEARRVNAKNLGELKNISHGSSVTLKPLKTEESIAHPLFPTTVQQLCNISVDILRTLNEAYSFAPASVTDKEGLRVRFLGFCRA